MYNAVDIAALILILLGTLQGLRRGLSGELASVFSVVVAFFAGWKFYAPIGEYIAAHTRMSEMLSNAFAFALCIVAGLIVMYSLGLLLQTIFVFTFKGKIERIGGALCGTIRLALIACAAIFLMGLLPSEFLQRHFADESAVGRFLFLHLEPVKETIVEKIPVLQAEEYAAEDEAEDYPEDEEIPVEDLPEERPVE
ncbi:MAG: CvpA family protein [Kiritimatiellia bacterium]